MLGEARGDGPLYIGAMTPTDPQIFKSTNSLYLHHFNQAGAGRGTYEGMCGGLSTLWLKNMLDGVRDVLSKPDEFRAQLLQARYRWDKATGGTDAVHLLQSVGLKGALLCSGAGVSYACEQIAAKGGAFLIWNGPHFVAAYIATGKFYFYDCEAGLFLDESKSEWKSRIRAMGYAGGSDESWMVWSVTH